MTGPAWHGIPEWLIDAIRAEHVAASAAGSVRAGADAADRLTDRLLREDPEFARVIVARYVRSLVRAPKARVRTKKDRARDALMAECARMDAEGMSLRAIGEVKGISHQTVSNLLAEWQVCLPEMTTDLVRAAKPAVNLSRQNPPADLTARVDSDPNVIEFRRPA